MATVVKSPQSKRQYEFNKSWGEDLDQSVDLFGAEVVHKKFVQQVDTDLGNAIRRMMNEGKTDEEIAAFVENYKPGVVTRTSRESIKTVAARLQAIKDDPNADPAEIEALRTKIRNYLAEVQQLQDLVEA